MQIFMDELNPPQIFYVMVSRVIFVVEVAKWRSALIRVEEASQKRDYYSLSRQYAANVQQYCKPRQPLESLFNRYSITLLILISTDLFAVLHNTLW